MMWRETIVFFINVACSVYQINAEEVGFHGAIAMAIEGKLPRDAAVISVECSQAYADIALGPDDTQMIAFGGLTNASDRSTATDETWAFGPWAEVVEATTAAEAKRILEKKGHKVVSVVRFDTAERAEKRSS